MTQWETHACVFVRVRVCACACMRVYVFYACVCVCVWHMHASNRRFTSVTQLIHTAHSYMTVASIKKEKKVVIRPENHKTLFRTITHTNTRSHAHTHTHTHTHTLTHTDIEILTHTYTHTHIRTYAVCNMTQSFETPDQHTQSCNTCQRVVSNTSPWHPISHITEKPLCMSINVYYMYMPNKYRMRPSRE